MQTVEPANPLAQAERQVREAEARVARQRAMIVALAKDSHRDEARLAARVLVRFEDHLHLAREDVQLERWVHDWLDGVGP